ncbi:uncharacterized protein [Aristolochia californica]|uniref:uncharacterized protein n=1 Tax=Aristolochia californica TaxID=171875 RepID=UPI0035DF9246
MDKEHITLDAHNTLDMGEISVQAIGRSQDKVGLGAFHMLDEEQLWGHQLELEHPGIEWDEFKELCTIRFGSPAQSNPLGDLQFQEKLARASKVVRVDQHVSLFTAGLTESLHLEVELLGPTDLTRAMNLARALETKQKFQTRRPIWQGGKNSSAVPTIAPPWQRNTATTTSTTPKPPPSTTAFIWKLNRSEMEERRSKGLSYNCDEQYTFSHQCKKLFWLEMKDEEEAKNSEVEQLEVEEPAISLHTITGLQSTTTMQVCAVVNEQPLLSLVDSGSTHNLLSFMAAKFLKLPIQTWPGASISVANGEKVPSYGINKEVRFTINNHQFSVEFFIIPLAGFDMVLGVKWLQTLGPILWDFSALMMSFEVGNYKVTLQECKTEVPMHLYGLQQHTPVDRNLDNLMDHFQDLFLEPITLPPLRHCHRWITLKAGCKVVVVRPYRYPHLQKDEIERQCRNMLKWGLIRPSKSPFTSPVLLVKKNDSTRRFCVDYHELNAKTIKDKFPIPVVDELLD